MSTSIPNTENTTPTVLDIARMCEKLDWYYAYSDDGAVYRAGKEAEARLRKLAAAVGPMALKVLDAWDTYVAEVSRGNKDTATRPTRAQFGLAEDKKPSLTLDQLASLGRNARRLNADALARGEYDSALVAAYLYKRRDDVDAVAALIAETANDNVFTLYGWRWAWIKRQEGDGCCWQGWNPAAPYGAKGSEVSHLRSIEDVIAWVLLTHW